MVKLTNRKNKEGIKIKRFLTLLISIILVLPLFGTAAFAEEKEMRAVWIATVLNLDFPKEKDNEAAQKAQFAEELDNLKNLGINTVFVQVRCCSDTFYKSDLNPWSEYLTGTQGKAPSYDPMEYMIAETHARGMEFHAWLNPYRVTMNGTDTSVLSDDNPAKQHPDWLITNNGALYYDPANEEVKDYIADTVGEIVRNYDVDGIHFDDYFYPSNYPLPEGESPDGEVANTRRNHVTDMVEKCYRKVKSIKRNVQFGISPSGIYKNEPTGKYGSAIKGYQAYYAVFADSKAWINMGIVDYIAPQVYWETNHSTAAYKTVTKYWEDMVKGTNVKLYIGEAVYKDNVAAEMKEHIEFSRGEEYVSGNIFFSYKDIMADKGGVINVLKSLYTQQAPEPSLPKPTLPVPTIPKPVTPEPVTPEPQPVTPEPSPAITPGSAETALPNSANVFVNSNKIAIDAYNINDYNYFKLRDIAVLMMGTGAKFSVLWDEATSTIIIVRGSSYMIAGGELTVGATVPKTALASTANIVVDGAPANISAYNIDGNNYYKLRDLASALGFNVDWNEAEMAVLITTN